MEFGLGALRLSPRDFWAMSLREYDRAVAGYVKSRGGGQRGMKTSRLQELQALYPDTPNEMQP